MDHEELWSVDRQRERADVCVPGRRRMADSRRMAGLRDRAAGRSGVADIRRWVTAAGWHVGGCEECPVRGRRGAVEYFVFATLRAH